MGSNAEVVVSTVACLNATSGSDVAERAVLAERLLVALADAGPEQHAAVRAGRSVARATAQVARDLAVENLARTSDVVAAIHRDATAG